MSTGGMGVVWEGRSSLGRRVVVKEPLFDKDHDEVKVGRLLIESGVLRTLNDELEAGKTQDEIHKHVVRYVDELSNSSHPFLVTEYLEAQSASETYGNKPLSEPLALRQVRTLLRTIHAIHSRDVVHRDISPSNILLDRGRGIVLIDFGTSIILRGELSQRSKQIGRVVFKRGFSAPELLKMQSDVRSDIFSVGATLFYFLTGRNPGDFIQNSTEGLPKLPREVNSKIPPTSLAIIRRAMSANPSNRFQSAGDMIREIETHLIQESRPPSTLTVGGVVYELRPGCVQVGRAHECDRGCRAQGYANPIQVRILDTQNFVEKHHAKIVVDSSGLCSIEDLKSVNRTAVKRGKSPFRLLSPSVPERLEDGDIIGLAYSPKRGPYVTFRFNDGRRAGEIGDNRVAQRG
jgi:serine/threonine-protein kinase